MAKSIAPLWPPWDCSWEFLGHRATVTALFSGCEGRVAIPVYVPSGTKWAPSCLSQNQGCGVKFTQKQKRGLWVQPGTPRDSQCGHLAGDSCSKGRLAQTAHAMVFCMCITDGLKTQLHRTEQPVSSPGPVLLLQPPGVCPSRAAACAQDHVGRRLKFRGRSGVGGGRG